MFKLWRQWRVKANLTIWPNLSDWSAREWRGVAESDLLAGVDIPGGHDDHPPVGVEVFAWIWNTIVIDPGNGSEQGSSPSPLPAKLVAISVQDTADLLDLVGAEAAVEKQLLMEELYNVNLLAI